MEPIQIRVGDQVNYVLDPEFQNPGVFRPAIVVQVWSDTMVNLLVFIDGDNDLRPEYRTDDPAIYTHWRTSVQRDDDNYQQGTWHPFAQLMSEELVDSGE